MKKVKVTEQNMKIIKKNIKPSVKRETKADVLKQRQRIRDALYKYIDNNKDKYFLIYPDFLAGYLSVIGKKQILTVHSVNENSVFQPVEKKETKSYLTMFIAQWGTIALSDTEWKKLQELIDLGCDLVYIMSVDDIKNKLG